MRTYISTKIVNAERMTNGDFWRVIRKDPSRIDPKTENDEGFYLEYPDNYRSWCPKDEFLRTYRPVSSDEKDLINRPF